MTAVVDSSAWIEYLVEGPNAGRFAAAIEDIGSRIVPTITVLEVYRKVLRDHGEVMASRSAALMCLGKVVDLDNPMALSAARLSLRHNLPMADSIVLATARAHDATVWTQDVDFDGIEGVRYFPAAKR
jgi:toxin FitB